MSQPELLTRVVEVLDRLGIESMITGSIASGLYGRPRSTHDVDLVVSMTAGSVDALMQAFSEPDYYLSRTAIEDAILRHGMFNLVSLAEGDKVDFWMLKSSPFDQSRFARRRRETLFGCVMCVATPEDSVLAKLVWARDSGGSEKQIADVRGILEVQAGQLDEPYLEQWIETLDVAAEWNQARTAP